MNRDRFYELVTLYLSNEISDSEIEEFESLLDENSNRKEFDSIRAKWDNSKQNKEEFKLDEGIELVTNKLKNIDDNFGWSNDVKDRKPFFISPMILRYAAVILLVVTGSLILYFSVFSNNGTIELDWNEKVTLLGKKSIIKYADGTKITLNSNSKLKYPTEFLGDTREIYLEGEAYFEVAQNNAKPFIVYSGQLVTEVLGTKFNISAFPNETNIIVSLVEGKVKVGHDEPKHKQMETTLVPNQQLAFNKNENTSSVEKFDSLDVIGWKKNILVFNDELLPDVFRKLQRTYGVDFELKDSSHENLKLTAKFENEDLWIVVKVIEKVTGLSYKSIERSSKVVKIVFE